MKRFATEDPASGSKRTKVDDEFDPSLQRNITDIVKAGSDRSGFITGTALMIWPVTHKMRFNLQSREEGNKKYRFDVEFSGACSPYFDKLAIHSQDVLQISLKGAGIVKKPSSSGPDSFPVVLKYTEGVCIRFVSRVRKPEENGLVIDTWDLSETEEDSKHDGWFSTPVTTVPIENTLSNKQHAPVLDPVPPPPVEETVQPSTSVDVPILDANPPLTTGDDDAREPEVLSDDPQSEEPVLSKRQAKRKEKKRRRELAKQKRAAKTCEGSHATSRTVSSNGSVPPKATASKDIKMGDPSTSRSAVKPVVTDQVSVSASDANPIKSPDTVPANQSEQVTGDPALSLKAGFKCRNGEIHTALEEWKPSQTLYNVIGVLTGIKSPSVTRSGDHHTSVTIIDPSNYDPSDPGLPVNVGLNINCFIKSHEQWLPQGNFGDIIILKGVKCQVFNHSIAGVGYWDKLRWAIYDSDAGKVHHGNQEDAQRSNGLSRGTACPLLQPNKSELSYCQKMADWWGAVYKLKEQDGTIMQVDSSMMEKPRRVHRLISEAAPGLPPHGFFDCTVEVLYGHPNDNEIYSIYVTDYTKNAELTAIQANWSKPELANRVLKVEMWPPSNDFAKEMRKGEFYSIRNIRMFISRGGYTEGTFTQLDKLRRLDEAEDADDLHFQALLQRKKLFESTVSVSRSTFKHRLFREAEIDSFLSCTVEVLHVGFDGDKSYMYVTDYTARSDLPLAPSESWSRGLQGRIVKITLWDGQVDMARTVEPGGYYTIHNLRWKKFASANEVQGRLGGEERLIHKFKMKDTAKEKLQALLLRKEMWQQNMVKESTSGETRQRSTSSTITSPQKTISLSTIGEVLANDTCPNQFRVTARVVDFYPLHLDNCVVLRCTRCQEDIPATQKACVTCDDMEHSYVSYLYRFFLCLQDDAGKRLRISVSDEECSLLKGLKLTDLQQDQTAAKRFSDRLAPIIGNLVQVHEGILRGERVVPETPVVEFTVESWTIPNDGRGPSRTYGLVNHSL